MNRQPSDHNASELARSRVLQVCLEAGANMILHLSRVSETHVSLRDHCIIAIRWLQVTTNSARKTRRAPESRRVRQTRRTRRALIAAADELFAEGRVPTVAAVAERADVARATAYRYFPSQEALLLETTFLGNSEALRRLPELARTIDDPAERMAEAVRAGAEWTLAREARLRMILRASLDPGSPTTRPARRRAYIAALLEPIADSLPPATYGRLAAALTLLFGIDPIVALADNSDIERERIPEVLAWTAHRLVEAALAEARPPHSTPARPADLGVRAARLTVWAAANGHDQTPRSTHCASSSFVCTGPASSRSQPGIGRPRISMSRASDVLTSVADSVGSTRTSKPPCPLAATAMFPPTRNARPPNIFLSVSAGSAATSSRMRSASSASYAMDR